MIRLNLTPCLRVTVRVGPIYNHIIFLERSPSGNRLAIDSKTASFPVYNFFLKTTKFISNVLEAVSKLKLKNSKNHLSNLVLYLPAYSYTGI